MPKGELSEGKLISVNLWAVGYALSMAVSNAYYAYFLTNIVYMSATDMGTIMFISRIVSALIVPLTSALLQNRSLPYLKKFGKYRTWIVTTVPLYAIMLILTFIPLNGVSRYAMMFYYFITYFIAYTLYSFPEASFYTMMLRVGNETDTIKIASHRAFFSSSSVMLYSMTCMPLVFLIGGDNLGKGYMWTVVIFCAIFIVFCYCSAFAYKEGDFYPQGDREAKSMHMSIAQQWRAFKSKAFFICFISDCFECFCHCFYDAATTYYFTYIIGDLSKITLFLSILNGVGIVAALIVGPVAEKLGVRKGYILTFIGMAGSLIGAFFFGETLMSFYIFMIIFRIAYGFTFCIDLLAYGEAANWHRANSGEDARAWAMNMKALPLKIGAACTAGTIGWTLGAFGFDATKAVQNADVLLTIRVLTTLLPGILVLVPLFMYTFLYPVKSVKDREEMYAKLKLLDNK